MHKNVQIYQRHVRWLSYQVNIQPVSRTLLKTRETRTSFDDDDDDCQFTDSPYLHGKAVVVAHARAVSLPSYYSRHVKHMRPLVMMMMTMMMMMIVDL